MLFSTNENFIDKQTDQTNTAGKKNEANFFLVQQFIEVLLSTILIVYN